MQQSSMQVGGEFWLSGEKFIKEHEELSLGQHGRHSITAVRVASTLTQ